MNDEGSTHYSAVLQQMGLGHRLLNDTFGTTERTQGIQSVQVPVGCPRWPGRLTLLVTAKNRWIWTIKSLEQGAVQILRHSERKRGVSPIYHNI